MKFKFLTTIYLLLLNINLISQSEITPSSLYNNVDFTKKAKTKIVGIKVKPFLTTNNYSTSRVVDNNDVHIFPSTVSQSEVHISINKNNPLNLITSCNAISTVGGFTSFNQGYYYTTNGGISWQGSDELQNSATIDVSGDPSTAFNSNNTGFIATMTGFVNCGIRTLPSGYSTQTTTDQGLNWSTFTTATDNGCFDKEMIVIDNQATSPFVNNIYTAWTNFTPGLTRVQFNRSTNNGTSYTNPITISNGIGQGTNLQTGPNGELYICWADYNVGETGARGLGFCRSLNGGVNITPSQRVFNYNGIRSFNTNPDRSSPAFGNTRVNDFPAMAVDKSNSVHRGRIYVIVPTREGGNGKAIIQISFSDNQGANWSNLQTINIPSGRQNWLPWITVDDCTGDVWAVYYSFDTPNGFETNTYVAHSTDGGITWENQKVSDVQHITSPIILPGVALGYAGDYIGIAAYAGKAYPIWADDRNGNWQLYCSPVQSVIDDLSISGADQFCTTSTYTVNSLPSGYSVVWSTSNSAVAIINSSTGVATGVNFGSCSIIASIIQIGSCGTPIQTITKPITIGNPNSLNILLTPTGTSLCTGTPFTAETYLEGATNYTWTPPTGLNIISGAGTATINAQVVSTPLSGPLTVTATNTCGTVTGTDQVVPMPDFPWPGKNQKYITLSTASCLTNTFTGQVIAVPNASLYTWRVREFDVNGNVLLTSPWFTSTTNQATYNLQNIQTRSARVFVYATTPCGVTPTISEIFNKCKGARIANSTIQEAITVTPNPTKGITRIALPKLMQQNIVYELTSASTGIVSKGKIIHNKNYFEIDLAKLTSGIYTLTLNDNKVIMQVKIIKE